MQVYARVSLRKWVGEQILQLAEPPHSFHVKLYDGRVIRRNQSFPKVEQKSAVSPVVSPTSVRDSSVEVTWLHPINWSCMILNVQLNQISVPSNMTCPAPDRFGAGRSDSTGLDTGYDGR